MSKELVVLSLIILISTTGSAYAIEPIFSIDRSAGFSFSATDLVFTCPDGSTFNDAYLEIESFSTKESITSGSSLIRFESDPNMAMRYTIMDGLTDGDNFKFTGIIYEDFSDPCLDATHPVSFYVMGQCNHVGIDNEEALVFVDENRLHDLTFVPGVSTMNSACTVPILDVQPDGFSFVNCIAPDVLDKATNTCTSPITPVVGPAGADGINGVDGLDAPHIDITNTGLNQDGTFTLAWSDGVHQNIGKIVGDAGPQGNAGTDGQDGSPGLQGEQGIQGDIGPIGPQGEVGNTGDIGPIGLIGLTGNDGSQGLKGDAGSRGFRGLTGPQGPHGMMGPQGIPGIQGTDGESLSGVPGPIGCLIDEKFNADSFSCEPRMVEMTGYDTRDLCFSALYLQSTGCGSSETGPSPPPVAGTSGIGGNGVLKGERIMLEVVNGKQYPVELNTISFGGSDYNYVKLPVDQKIPVGNAILKEGMYTIINNPVTGVDRDKPILRAGEKVGIYLTLKQNFADQRFVAANIWTHQGESAGTGVQINTWSPSPEPFSSNECPFPPRNLSDYWDGCGSADWTGNP